VESNEIKMCDKTDLNIMILNARSINEYLKKLLIIDLLRSKNIDVALIQETFLIKGDKLYFNGYKIFRDENYLNIRKGTAILVNSALNVECSRIAADPQGRFIKIRIKNRMNDDSLTISSVYLEPNGDLDDINQIIFESDVIGGDMNKANTNLNKLEFIILRI